MGMSMFSTEQFRPGSALWIMVFSSSGATPGDVRLFVHGGASASTTYIYEIDKSSFTIINSRTALGYSYATGIGGINDRLFCGDHVNTIYEVNPNTLFAINSKSESTYYVGIGGTQTKLIGRRSGDKYYEIDPDTLVTSTSYSPSYAKFASIGGSEDNRFFSHAYDLDQTYSWNIEERDASSFSVINSNKLATTYSGQSAQNSYDLAAYDGSIYIINRNSSAIFEIDQDTLAYVSVDTSTTFNLCWGIGTTK